MEALFIALIVLWFANGWYINDRLEKIHKRFDRIEGALDGLREYLYEIDPQFDDERKAAQRFHDHMNDDKNDIFSGMDHCKLIQKKKSENKRTLNTPFVSNNDSVGS